jgi:nucleoside-diphosphate-sugar epimerase
MVIFRFAKWLIDGSPLHLNGDGSQSRGFTYVDDIARGTIQALRPVGYEIINLGGHESITIRELISLMEKITGKTAEIVQHPFPKADMLTNHADTEKARQLLDWQPEVGLEEGLKNAVQWYLDHQDWAKDLDVGL